MSNSRALNIQGRQAALVCAAAAILWIGAQWLGPSLGLPGQYAILFDLMALAAFAWAMVVTFRVWRRQSTNPGQNKQG
jgi:Family of unknown function (DUF5337)